jgi:(2Fe-2S) ferredoxin
VVLYPEKNWYAKVKVEDLDDITAHLAGGPHVQRLDTIDSSLKELIYQLLDTGVF